MFAVMTWNQYYHYYLQQLQQVYEKGEAASVTSIIFENKAGITRKHITIHPDEIMSARHKEILDESLQLLLQHTPVQQVTGEAWFYHLRFIINEHVLVPRPETEELVKWVLDENDGYISILDIGSGSGCIPVAIKKNLPAAAVTSVDVSEEALAVAKQNAAVNNTSIDFLQLDFLDEKEWQRLAMFDVIISNPPYIPLSEKEHLDKNVVAFEPGIALFVPDKKPLLFYEGIAAFAKTHLKKDGKIYLETHEDLAEDTAQIFRTEYKEATIRKDINGKNRMVKVVF